MFNNSEESESLQSFEEWFSQEGGKLHLDLLFSRDLSGLSVHTLQDLPSNTTVASCPFSLAITSDTTSLPLEVFCKLTLDDQHKLSERQRISTYIALHWIISEASGSNHLLCHRPYINVLPRPETLLTPLYFSEDELDLFKCTNLYGSTMDQRISWKAEWQNICASIRQGSPEIAEKFTWDMYLAASTYLSSRAFPSTLLSRTPSLLVTPSSYPVLIPGVDSFNHARGQPVTWGISQLSECSNHPNSASSINSSDLCVSLTLNVPASAGAELFNNYGPKSNASFILGYGFALQDNPDDTILLKVGSGPSGREVVDDVKSATSGSGHEIGRNAKGADKLWNDVRELLSTSYRSQEPETSIEEEHQTAKDLQLDMETTDTLSDMVSSLLYRFPSLTKDLGSANVRKEVRMMWEHYVRGQVDILESLLAWLEGKEREAVRRADELGIDVVGEDTDE